MHIDNAKFVRKPLLLCRALARSTTTLQGSYQRLLVRIR